MLICSFRSNTIDCVAASNASARCSGVSTTEASTESHAVCSSVPSAICFARNRLAACRTNGSERSPLRTTLPMFAYVSPQSTSRPPLIAAAVSFAGVDACRQSVVVAMVASQQDKKFCTSSTRATSTEYSTAPHSTSKSCDFGMQRHTKTGRHPAYIDLWEVGKLGNRVTVGNHEPVPPIRLSVQIVVDGAVCTRGCAIVSSVLAHDGAYRSSLDAKLERDQEVFNQVALKSWTSRACSIHCRVLLSHHFEHVSR